MNRNSFISLIRKGKIIFLILFFIAGCGKTSNNEDKYVQKDVAYLPQTDLEIQKYNIEIRKKQTAQRFPCDTISLMEFILNHYPEGSYLVTEDRLSTYDLAAPALLYFPEDRSYIFGVVAASKPGERLVEIKNIVGYDQSYIDLDSTELGTAFFYLVLFKCDNGNFTIVWEAPIPSHGGFNYISLNSWEYFAIKYLKVNFYYAQGSGNISYNYFLINGIEKPPHLVMTYEGINFRRTLAKINDDKFPDYYEHIFYDDGSRIVKGDSIPFVWNYKDSVYQNLYNKKHTRLY